jgi:hypothetical protein
LIVDPRQPAISHRKPKVDTGFIQISNDAFLFLEKYDGAFFSYSKGETHSISRHYISQRSQLELQVVDDKITLPFSVGSIRKSYKLNFKVRDNLKYDVLLGRNWQGEVESDENDSRARINRNAKSKLPPYLSPPLYANLLICIQARFQDTVAVNIPSFADFTADAYFRLSTRSSQPKVAPPRQPTRSSRSKVAPPRQPTPQTTLPPQYESSEEDTSYQMTRMSDDMLPPEKFDLTMENLCKLDSTEDSVIGTDTFDNNGLELLESKTSLLDSHDDDSEDCEGGGCLLFKGRSTLRE